MGVLPLPFTRVILLLPGCFSALTAPREVSGPVGGTLSVPCQYQEGAEGSKKYWCRGEEWRDCYRVIETEESKVKVNRGRVSITDNHTRSTFTVTIENLTLGDAGIYWCGIDIRFGRDSCSLVNVTVLPALSTTVMVMSGSPFPAIGSDSTAEPHTNSPFTSAMVLLPVTLLVLLLLLIGAILLARRMMLKRKKAAGTIGPSQAVNEAVTSTESDLSYATVKPTPRKSPHSAQPEPGPERVDYAVVAAGRTDISYTTVKYPTLGDQPIYVNVDRPSHQTPWSSPLEQTEYRQVKKK